MTDYTILLIEDDYAIIRGLKDSFSARRFSVLTAMDGQEAIDLALARKPDLILLDIMLPKVNGFEVCRSIRAAELDMPIIMLTAKDDEADVIRGLNLGADDYVTKPFSMKQLHARCDAFLRRHAKPKDETVQFGHCMFNPSAREVLRNGENVKLTPKEFALLGFFIRREGHALTRETILQAVWPNGFLSSDRSVDRCVNTLRKKLEENPKKPNHIVSIRDIGYRFQTK